MDINKIPGYGFVYIAELELDTSAKLIWLKSVGLYIFVNRIGKFLAGLTHFRYM